MLRGLKKFRPYLAPLLVVATLAFFIYFFTTHAAIRQALVHTSPWVLLEIGALYGVFIVCLAWVYDLTLRLCGHHLGTKENLLLTCYSTIANFFGPLQSGPGVRAVYLKQKHRVNISDYTLATLFYYACYAVISAIFILIGSGKLWPWALVMTVGVTAFSASVVLLAHKRFIKKSKTMKLNFTPKIMALLFIATIVQLSIVALIFYTELHAIGAKPSATQAIAYGGAANFALFVALTPGAIGFREAFLTFSQQIHHINTAHILAASVIDRAVYVVFLGMLFLLVLAMHADRRFRVKPTPSS